MRRPQRGLEFLGKVAGHQTDFLANERSDNLAKALRVEIGELVDTIAGGNFGGETGSVDHTAIPYPPARRLFRI